MKEQGIDGFIDKQPDQEQIFNLVVDAIAEAKDILMNNESSNRVLMNAANDQAWHKNCLATIDFI